MAAAMRRSAGSLAAALVVFGCGGDPVGLPRDPEPFLYLVLGQDTRFQGLPDDSAAQYAVLLDASSPTDPIVLRSGGMFEMRRATDDARFDWRDLGREGEVTTPGSSGATLVRSVTHRLADSLTAAGLGADSLTPLTTYELTVEVDGLTITGSARTPGVLTLEVSQERTSATWNQVEGAAGYRVIAAGSPVLTTATSYPLSDDDRQLRMLRVEALDRNAWEYFTDPSLTRSGLDRGRGVFGAMTAAVAEW